jgi:lipopolysaccharide/colanic/teichoic acid biosynthesis glycosyltransferase
VRRSDYPMCAKRLLDFLLASLGLLVLSPLLLLVGLAILLGDGLPVLYVATRVGQHGRPFHLYKFRTMVKTDPGSRASSQGSSVTVFDDPRITRLGKVLRSLKIDEFPQLLNVVRGDMSLVGPRPEDPEYVALYTEEQRGILALKPGITGVAALEYWDETEYLKEEDWERIYREQLVPAKLALELEYAARRTFWTDLRVLCRTFTGLSSRMAGGRR